MTLLHERLIVVNILTLFYMVHNHKATNDILLSNRPENVMLGRTKKVYKVNITIYILWDMHTNRQHKYFFYGRWQTNIPQ